MKPFLFFLLFITCASNLTNAQTDELYCAKIRTSEDRINGSISHETPKNNPIVFSRFPKKDTFIYIIQLKKVTKYKSSGNGVIIEFENGMRIERDLKVSIRINDDTEFEHFIKFKLTEDEVDIFKTQLVKEISLHQLQFTVDNPQKYQAYIRCIDESKPEK